MKKLTIRDFKRVRVDEETPPYFQYFTKDMREICLEPCISGFCVGIYDDDENLIGTKKCTDIKNDMQVGMDGMFRFGEDVAEGALEKAVDIANQMLAVCQECNGNGEHLIDDYDHRGEHTQRVDKCLKCDGKGTVQ